MINVMDIDTGTEVKFQSDYALLLDSNRNKTVLGRMSIRGRRDRSAISAQLAGGRGVGQGDFGLRLKDCCKYVVYCIMRRNPSNSAVVDTAGR